MCELSYTCKEHSIFKEESKKLYRHTQKLFQIKKKSVNFNPKIERAKYNGNETFEIQSLNLSVIEITIDVYITHCCITTMCSSRVIFFYYLISRLLQ